jgi:hypothetical protein
MPKYYDYVTTHDTHRRAMKKERLDWQGDWFVQMLDHLDKSKGLDDRDVKATLSQLLAEMMWERDGRPYYSVHPKLVTKLCQVDFSKVPSNLIVTPKPHEVVCIRLNKENDFLSIEKGKYFLRSMLVWKRSSGTIVNYDDREFEVQDDVLVCWMDFGEINEEGDIGIGSPIHTYKCFPIKEGQMIDEAFDHFPPSPDLDIGVQVPEDFAKNCIKLFISVGFLASSETPLTIFDILNKDIHKWTTATEEERGRMITRAKKRGKNGFLVGYDQMFINRDLKYSHIRAGHPHLYWYGPGKSKLKMRFVAPTTVRKDLSFKDKRNGQ